MNNLAKFVLYISLVITMTGCGDDKEQQKPDGSDIVIEYDISAEDDQKEKSDTEEHEFLLAPALDNEDDIPLTGDNNQTATRKDNPDEDDGDIITIEYSSDNYEEKKTQNEIKTQEIKKTQDEIKTPEINKAPDIDEISDKPFPKSESPDKPEITNSENEPENIQTQEETSPAEEKELPKITPEEIAQEYRNRIPMKVGKKQTLINFTYQSSVGFTYLIKTTDEPAAEKYKSHLPKFACANKQIQALYIHDERVIFEFVNNEDKLLVKIPVSKSICAKLEKEEQEKSKSPEAAQTTSIKQPSADKDKSSKTAPRKSSGKKTVRKDKSSRR